MMKNTLIILLCLFFSSAVLRAQHSISGKVSSEEGLASEATVTLINGSDSAFVAGLYTDSLGFFRFIEIEQGDYILKVQHLSLGHARMHFTLQRDTLLENIVLENIGTTLKEVVVRGQRIRLEQSLDQIAVNLDQAVLSDGGTALEVVKQMPFITFDPQGNISIAGKSDIQILIDGKISGFAASQGVSFLEQLDVSTIQRIELILNPSAKQDAGGGAGIINIIRKKNQDQGWKGAGQISLGNRDRYGTSISLNNRKNSWNGFLNYSFRQLTRRAKSESEQIQTQDGESFILLQNGRNKRFDKRHQLEAGVDYYFSDHSYLTLAANVRYRDKDAGGSLESRFSQQNDRLLEERRSILQEPENNNGYGMELRYRSQPEDGKPLMDALFEVFHSLEDETIRRGDRLMDNGFTQDSLATFYKDYNDRIAISWDLEYQMENDIQLEWGVQWIYRDIEQDYLAQFASGSGQTLVLQDSLDNQFFYTDHIAAVYGNWRKDGDHWQFELGMRAEQLFNHYSVSGDQKKFDNRLFSFFPSLKIGFFPGENQNLSFSYNRRINRPSPNRLNPFPDFAQPYRLQIGNPELKPEFIDQFSLGYSRQWSSFSWFSVLFYKNYQDLIQRITTPEQDGTTLLSPINIYHLYNYGWNNNIGYRSEKIDMQLSIIYFINQFDSKEVDNDGDGYQLKWVGDWQMDDHFAVQMLANYFGPSEVSQGSQKSYFFCELGLKWEFNKNRTSLSFQLSDVFDTLREATVIDIENLFRENIEKIDTRRVQIALSWKF